MRIVGIDIAVSDQGTAFCEGYIDAGVLHVEQVHVGSDDEDILKRMRSADWCGIDAPFGWPVAFVESVVEFAGTNRWPVQPVEHLSKTQRLSPRLRLRATDLAVQAHTQGLDARTANPLSVSTELISGCAMRTAYLLTEFAQVVPEWKFDRTGMVDNDRRILEVYPGASLACWNIDRTGYKGTTPAHRAARERIAEDLFADLPSGAVSFASSSTRDDVLTSDHALDAFISFLVTAVASRPGGAIEPANAIDSAQLAAEGWIHLPATPLRSVRFA